MLVDKSGQVTATRGKSYDSRSLQNGFLADRNNIFAELYNTIQIRRLRQIQTHSQAPHLRFHSRGSPASESDNAHVFQCGFASYRFQNSQTATHPHEASKGFKYLGAFADLAAAKQAVESSAAGGRRTRAIGADGGFTN